MADKTPEEQADEIALELIQSAEKTHAKKLKISTIGGISFFKLGNLYALPSEIGRLIELLELDISFNNIFDLPDELWQLTNLISLDISANPINQLPAGIGHLTNLERLNISGTSIASLPKEILRLKKLTTLDVQDTKLSIPPEISQKIYEPQKILNYYFSIINQKKTLIAKQLNETKLLFVGQGAVGKTSIICRLLHNNYKIDEPKTEGIWISKGETSDDIQLNIWDFGGQEIMHATHQFFLTKRSLYVLVLDSRLSQEENRAEYWLKIIQSFGGESPVLLVGNKIDQHPLDIDRTGLQKKYPNIVGILETSAATGAGIEELKAAITEQVNRLPHVRDLLPETWFTVKTKLEELGRQSNFITHDKYLDLCAENEVTDEISQLTLIGFLHDLGVVLHFQDDPRLEALGILNPQWVTNGVYKILNSQPLFKNKGVLTVAMLDEILNLPEYPRNKRLFIVDMMKKFELCYDIESDKTFLVPDLLPKDALSTGSWDDTLAFLYEYPVLPSSVMTRFIVRINSHIEGNQVWRSGVVLKIGEPISGRVNHAMLRADLEDKKISINIGGPEHTRRDTLAIIRHQLDEIHASIKGLNPKRKIPVPGQPGIEPLDYEYLLELERDDIPICHAFNGQRNIKIDVKQLLNGIESEDVRRMTYINISGSISGSVVVGDDNTVEGGI
ncbi:MAG: GTP-binding protein [Chloroflexi bacterium HGW-Chloroflexi-6]|nr:MAG: GTP-binding protein [Chloroflexi bacterium HGW-Chloroflexi-6]